MSLDNAILTVGSVGVVVANVLAQVAPTVVPGVEGLPPVNFNSLTATGILAWYAWYVTTRSQPKLLNDMRASLERMQQVQVAETSAHREERAKERAEWLAALREMRCQYESRDEDNKR